MSSEHSVTTPSFLMKRASQDSNASGNAPTTMSSVANNMGNYDFAEFDFEPSSPLRRAFSSSKQDQISNTFGHSNPGEGYRRLQIAYIDQYGKLISELEPDPDKINAITQASGLSKAMMKFKSKNTNEKKAQEEKAWQVAEMIVDEVRSITSENWA